MKTVSAPCHRGVVNGACGFMGRPHPSHSFIAPHPTGYETALSGTPKKLISTDELLADERGSLFIPVYESICVGFGRFP